jgi:hypothetical protein
VSRAAAVASGSTVTSGSWRRRPQPQREQRWRYLHQAVWRDSWVMGIQLRRENSPATGRGVTSCSNSRRDLRISASALAGAASP